MTLKAETHQIGGFPVLSLAGELDVVDASELRSAFARLETHGDDLIVDLSDVTYIDSSTLGELIVFDTRLARRGATLAIASQGDDLRRFFRTRGLVTLLHFFDSPDEAAAFLGSAGREPA